MASSNVITVVMIRVIAKKTPARGKGINKMINRLYKKDFFLHTEERSLASGRDTGNDHGKEDHHGHHSRDAHRHLCYTSNSRRLMTRVSEILTRRVYKVYMNLPYLRSLDEQRRMLAPRC